MTAIKKYHRPNSVDEAIKLLSPTSAILAGGTYLVPHLPAHVTELIDLQNTRLAKIEITETSVRVGAMVNLQTLVEQSDIPHIVRQAARSEGPNTMRNQATIGGVVAGKDWESELIAALLVHETMLTLETTQGTQTKALEDYLADKLENTIITAITFARGGKSALERVARTPKDTAIVAVAGRVGNGISRFAFTGLAPTPILLSPAKLTSLTPPADFRGSAAYRLDIAHTLSTRVQNTLEKQS